MADDKSARLFARARKRIPGGVNSPVRSWTAVGGTPRFIVRGQGASLYDADGRAYVDYVGSWGPLILGHAHPEIVTAITEAALRGTTFGAPTEGEVELAEMVHALVPSIDKLRLVSSGTEATMSAVRLARAYTGRSRIVKFDGCYHGHVDSMLVRAGSGAATLSLPDSPGVPQAFTRETLIAPFNDIGAVERLVEREASSVAAVIVEPVCGNMGVIPPGPGFLASLRDLTRHHGALLIFDEVISGFRVAPGGAQELYGVVPDLTCFGKVLGGGLPLAAFGGSQGVMDLLAPAGPVYQAGTLSGNPLAVAAGRRTLEVLSHRQLYRELEEKGRQVEEGIETVLRSCGIPGKVNRVGSMFTLFFGVQAVRSAQDARGCDRERFARFFHGMLDRGVYFPPSPFESAFVSLAHGSGHLERSLEAFAEWAANESAR